MVRRYATELHRYVDRRYRGLLSRDSAIGFMMRGGISEEVANQIADEGEALARRTLLEQGPDGMWRCKS